MSLIVDELILYTPSTESPFWGDVDGFFDNDSDNVQPLWWLIVSDLLSGISFSSSALVGLGVVFYGEFDPGSGRTLAACLTHASRAERPFGVLERRTGE